MNLSTADILVFLGAIAVLAAAAFIITSHRAAAPVQVEPGPEGRHHLPPGLIDGPTARLGPDTLTKLQKAPKPAE